MAPSMDLPEIDMSALQQMDILQSYLLLFQYMIEDFVHKDDLVTILSSNIVLGSAPAPDYTIKGGITTFASLRTDAAARAKNIIYDKAAKTGAVVRSKTLSGLEALV